VIFRDAVSENVWSLLLLKYIIKTHVLIMQCIGWHKTG